MLRRGGPSHASGRRRFGRSPQFLAPDPDSGKHDEDAEFWSRRLDDPRPKMPLGPETTPPQSRLEPTRPAPGARDAPPARPTVDAATERHDAEPAELADATKAELQRVAVEYESAADARRDEAERHEVKLVELADATRAELSRIAARFERVTKSPSVASPQAIQSRP